MELKNLQKRDLEFKPAISLSADIEKVSISKMGFGGSKFDPGHYAYSSQCSRIALNVADYL